MADWKYILSNKEEAINEEELLKYLEGNLTEEEKHATEQKMAASSFANDAVEGLQQFDHKKDLKKYVDQLNKNLHQQLNARKLKKQKRRLKDYAWIYIALLIILAFCILGYVVIKMHSKGSKSTPPVQQQNTTFQSHPGVKVTYAR